MTKRQALSRTGFAGILDRPYLILVLTSLFWGGNTLAGKLAVGQIDPYTLIVLRWSGAILCVLPFALPHLGRDWPAIRRGWPLLALYGALGYASFNALMYVAAYSTSGVNLSIEQASIPVLVMVGNFVVFRVRARPLQIVGVVLTILGVVITAVHGDLGRIAALAVNIGDLLVLSACLAYTVHSLALRFRPAIHWLSFLLMTFIAALAAGLVFEILLGGGIGAVFTGTLSGTPLGWAIVVYVALFPSVLSQLFYARGVELLGANRASLFINLIPVFGTLLSILVLSERLELYHFVTAVLVVLGIVLAEFAARRVILGEGEVL